MSSTTPPRVEYINSFTVHGLSIRTQNRDEFNQQTAKIPRLWQQLYSGDLTTGSAIFSVYSDYESDENGHYNYTLGINQECLRTDFHPIPIQAGQYLVFEGTGPMPATVVATWMAIWDYFANTGAQQRCFISDFETYAGQDKVSVYIGIK